MVLYTEVIGTASPNVTKYVFRIEVFYGLKEDL